LKASAGFSSSCSSPEEARDDGLETVATSEDDIEAISMSPRAPSVSAMMSGGGGSFISIFLFPQARVLTFVRILDEKYASERMYACMDVSLSFTMCLSYYSEIEVYLRLCACVCVCFMV